MKIAKSGGDNRVIDPGMYRVKCVSAEAEDKPDDAFGKTKKIRFTFKTVEVKDTDGEAIELERVVNRAFNPKANLYGIFQAFGLPVDNDAYEPDTDDLLGKEANAIVVDYTAEGDGSQWSRVERLTPLPKGAQKKERPYITKEAERVYLDEPPFDTADAEAEAQALNAWWDEADKDFLRRVVNETCAISFPGKTPKDLTASQRAELMVELKRGT